MIVSDLGFSYLMPEGDQSVLPFSSCLFLKFILFVYLRDRGHKATVRGKSRLLAERRVP